MKYWIIFVLVSFYSLAAMAQINSLSGIVKFENGKPVSDATVVIKNHNKHVLTDEKGKFEFSNLAYGKYEILVFSVEIRKKSFHVNVADNNKPVNLIVEQSEVSLNEVVVSANSKKKAIESNGFAVNVIETQKVAVKSIQTNELLDRTAGVRVRQDGGLGSNINYNINGLSGNAIKIFIDGIPTSNYGSSFSLNSIPPAMIERIEVYKGVVPGYLAEDALGGAINIVLKRQNKKSLSTSYSIGSFNTHQWNMSGGFRWKSGLTFDASAFYNYSDNDYKVWGDDIYFFNHKGDITESNGKKVKRFHDAYESLGGKFNIGFTDVKWADQFLIAGVLSKDYKEAQNASTMEVVYGNRHFRHKSAVMTLAYSKKDLFTDGFTLKIDASHSYLRRQVIDTVGIRYGWQGPILDENGDYAMYNSGAEVGDTKNAAIDRDYSNMVRTSFNYQINDNHTFFANYLFNDFQRKSADEFQPLAFQKLKNTRDLQKNILSLTYENRSFSGKLRTNVFYKRYFQKAILNEPKLDTETKEYKVNITHNNIDNSGYGLTLSYALLPNLYFLGSAEQAIRFPSATELFGNTSGSLLAAPNLRPEKSINANLGVNFGTYTIANHSFSLNTSLYYRDTKDMIRRVVVTSNEQDSQYENHEKVETKGIDAELNYNYADRFSFRFDISKFDVLFNTRYDAKGHPYKYYRMQIRNEPSLKFNSNMSYYHKHLFLKNSKASIYYNIGYVNKFLRNWGGVGSNGIKEIPSQSPIDLGLTYTFPKDKIVLSFDVKNILDRQIFDNYGLQKPGRAFYAKISYIIY